MPWDDVHHLEQRLAATLIGMDFEGAAAVSEEVIDKIYRESEPMPDLAARRMLQWLRRKRQFASMAAVADALMQTGARSAQIRRQYAQSLIEQRLFSAAEMTLEALIRDTPQSSGEYAEARGLMGRLLKQIYVTTPGISGPRQRELLQRALAQYASVYAMDAIHTWHGINVVALLARAHRDGVAVEYTRDYRSVAQQVLNTLAEREAESTNGLVSWDIATKMEAFIALDRHREAEDAANQYAAASETDDFEIGSTLRQLTEVWELHSTSPTGSGVLPILRAAQAHKSLHNRNSGHTEGTEEASVTVPFADAQMELEKVFGSEKSVSLKWYLEGLSRAKSVCRIEAADGKGEGTGWLVRASDFLPNETGRLLVLTNDHVVSETCKGALRPPNAWCKFQLLGQTARMKRIVWSSPVDKFDAALLELERSLDGEPVPLCAHAVEMCEPAPRMYIIGHPGGRDVEFSLQDNQLVACTEHVLHYRTPTEGGSSGSPVFEPRGWQAVGLHHGGSLKMGRVKGRPNTFYAANEGITIQAVQRAAHAR
jgi:hypothetical protein